MLDLLLGDFLFDSFDFLPGSDIGSNLVADIAGLDAPKFKGIEISGRIIRENGADSFVCVCGSVVAKFLVIGFFAFLCCLIGF